MYARIVAAEGSPEKVEESIAIMKERNAPLVSGQPGFHRGYWCIDRNSGMVMSVTLWETQADEKTSRANIPGIMENMAHVLSGSEYRQETFEVIHDA